MLQLKPVGRVEVEVEAVGGRLRQRAWATSALIGYWWVWVSPTRRNWPFFRDRRVDASGGTISVSE